MRLNNRLIQFFIWGLLIIIISAISVTAEEVTVIVNLNNPVNKLSSREISDIFLARRRVFPSGDAVTVLEHVRNSPLRESFFHLLNRMTLKQVNAYWARLQFSGEVQPPESLPDSASIIDVVRKNPAAIGYVDAMSVDKSVKIVLQLKE